MSLPSDWNTGKFIEWSTELPFPERPRSSPAFFIQNTECYFYFTVKIGEFFPYRVYLKPKAMSSILEPFDLVIYFNFGGLKFKRSVKRFLKSQESIYNFNSHDISHDKTCCTEGHFVRFCFILENESKTLFRVEKKTDNKCLQTSSYLKADVSVQTGSYLNTDVAVESLCEDYTKLLELSENHDAEIKCGEHSIKVHKSILSARSEVFKRMLQSDMVEGRNGIVEIHDIDISYIKDFVKYLYTGRIPEMTFNKAKILYELGDRYGVKSLMLRCSDYFQDNLSSDNACDCLALADGHSDEKLKESAVAYIAYKKIYLQDEQWLPFCKSFPTMAVEVYKLSYKNVSDSKDH